MKRIYTIIATLVPVLVLGVFAYGQLRHQPVKARAYNSAGVTLKKNKILKEYSTWTELVTLDTTYYVHQLADTAGNGRNSQGSLGLKALLADTLGQKGGTAHEVRFYPIAAPSTDSIFIYGTKVDNPYASVSDSTAGAADTVIWASTTQNYQTSKYQWTQIDSFRIRLANDGTDTIKVYYRPSYGVVVADSNATNVVGVLIGYTFSGSTDTIAAANWGYMVTEGDAQVYMSGKSVNIEVGDLLTVGNNGKAVKYLASKTDTIRTSAAVNARYIQGARPWDAVQLTPIRAGKTLGTVFSSIDTTRWGYELVSDSLRVIQISHTGTVLAGSVVDSLSYTWIPRGSFDGKDRARIIGEALEACTTDSTLKWMRLFKR